MGKSRSTPGRTWGDGKRRTSTSRVRPEPPCHHGSGKCCARSTLETSFSFHTALLVFPNKALSIDSTPYDSARCAVFPQRLTPCAPNLSACRLRWVRFDVRACPPTTPPDTQAASLLATSVPQATPHRENLPGQARQTTRGRRLSAPAGSPGRSGTGD
jgi:hypothetical protein